MLDGTAPSFMFRREKIENEKYVCLGFQSFFILLLVVARRRHSHSHRRSKRFQTLKIH